MKLQAAAVSDIGTVLDIVHRTVESVYSAFYPADVVHFFLEHHSDANIREDIGEGRVYLLSEDGTPVGTGTVRGNEICRVFVLPEYHHRGYGTFIMKELETVVARTSRSVRLDSSLPGYGLYLKLGYRPVDYQMISTPNGQVLCYHVMEKALVKEGNRIGADEAVGTPSYDGRKFSPSSSSSNSDASDETLFSYHQDGRMVWAEYSGGRILRGQLLGTAEREGDLEFSYEHLTRNYVLRTGRCRSVPETLSDGRLRLREKWSWTNGDCTSGESVLDEIPR